MEIRRYEHNALTACSIHTSRAIYEDFSGLERGMEPRSLKPARKGVFKDMNRLLVNVWENEPSMAHLARQRLDRYEDSYLWDPTRH
jgi:hypothetical protein